MPQSPRLKMAHDIDGALAKPYTPQGNIKLAEARQLFHDDYFSIININGENYPHLNRYGLYAYFRWLDSLGAEIAFISSGLIARGGPYVEDVLKKSLGEARYHELKSTLKIHSLKRIVEGKVIHDFSDPAFKNADVIAGLQPNIENGRGHVKKDLTALWDSNLENALLIENQRNYCMAGQEQNVCYLPSIEDFVRSINNFEPVVADEATGAYRDSDYAFYNAHLFPYINGIFFITGLIDWALTSNEQEQQTEKSITTLIYEQLNKPREDKSKPPRFNWEIYKDISIYERGLAILKCFDPALELITPHNIKLLQQPPHIFLQNENESSSSNTMSSVSPLSFFNQKDKAPSTPPAKLDSSAISQENIPHRYDAPFGELNKFSSVHLAILNHQPAKLKELLEDGANPNQLDIASEVSPLIHAILRSWEEQLEVIDLLIKHGADVNLACHCGTPLQVALGEQPSEERTALIKKLLNYGANPLQQNKDGLNAIHSCWDNKSNDFLLPDLLAASKKFQTGSSSTIITTPIEPSSSPEATPPRPFFAEGSTLQPTPSTGPSSNPVSNTGTSNKRLSCQIL
jgi:hypothetical protein